MVLGIITSNPGVFQANPDPYPQKPVPTCTGTGYPAYGYGITTGQEPHFFTFIYLFTTT
jgi:hypothetical protein